MEKIFIDFIVPTAEAIRLECRNCSNYAEKEIFCVNGMFFFFYLLNQSIGIKTVSLREITEKEYNIRKEEILAARPDETSRRWSKEGNQYALKVFHNGVWKRSLFSDQCIFLTDNPLKDRHDKIVAQEMMKREAEEKQNRQMKKDYAQKCNILSRKLNISFVNVLRLGLEEKKLLAFKKSYNQALYDVRFLPLKKLRLMYEKLRTGRINRKSVLDELKVQYFDADVNIMDFSELLEIIKNALADYVEQSLKKAVQNGAEMPYTQRVEVYKKLCHQSREVKREALATLGVEVEAIEFKRYPFRTLQQQLAATIGVDLSVV